MNNQDCNEFVFPEYVQETLPDKPKPNNSLPDLRQLTGEKKAEAIRRLIDIIENSTDSKLRYSALLLMEAESYRNKKRAETANEYFNAQIKDMQLQAIEDFKVQAKVKFSAKYSALIQKGQFSPEMMRDFDIIQKMERAACYMMDGLTVYTKECNKCERRKRCFGEE